MPQSNPMQEIHLITLDPAHFHAALVQKEMYAGVSPIVSVYAPLTTELTEHLTRVARFNLRPDNPTSWELYIHTSPDPLARMLRDAHPGSAVVLSGRNRSKIERIEQSVAKGLHVLADKPWILRPEDLPRVAAALDAADNTGLIAFDMMTERFEITSILHRALVNTPEVFGTLEKGTPSQPAIFMDSMHRLIKTVAGVPMLRPVDFFDIDEQGEALNDVGTHLVDLVQWIAFPDTALDYRTDIAMLAARRWPTILNPAQWSQVTGGAKVPNSLASFLHNGDVHYYGNNFVSYTLRGIHVQMNVRWDLEGVSDTYIARFQGSKSTIELRQGEAENFRPELYIIPNTPTLHAETGAALRHTIHRLQSSFEGLGIEDHGTEFRLTIPDRFRVGHEAHFGEVTRQFFGYLRNPQSLPAWEKPNMLAKYYVSTTGVAMAARP